MKKAIEAIGIITLVISSLFTVLSILAIFLGNKTDTATSFSVLTISIPSLFTGLFFMALADIIKTLQQIRDKK